MTSRFGMLEPYHILHITMGTDGKIVTWDGVEESAAGAENDAVIVGVVGR